MNCKEYNEKYEHQHVEFYTALIDWLKKNPEHASNETGLSVARRVLPARRIPWSEQ